MADQADTLSIPTNPVRPAAGVTMPSPRVPDLVRPGAEPSSAAPSLNQRVDQPVGLRDNEVEARKLIVGRGTSLSGEITSCDRLIIDGSVEANLQNCQHMAITETGVFNGNAAIDDVEVSGRVEGDLVVRKRLLIRASGRVSGTITYGEIEIEAGGRLSDAEIARRAGLAERRYGHYVRGVREPDFETLLRICSVLDLTPNEVG